MRRVARWAALVAATLLPPSFSFAAQGQRSAGQGQEGEQQPPPNVAVTVTVVGTTPLPGVEVPANQIPAPVQTSTSQDLESSGAIDLSHLLNSRFGGVHVNEIQGNPFQADVSFRGYTASPLLGTPQGLSVYLDGVRLNQPFGEVVSWDLIPRAAIASSTLMPGSNPLFGLNTLGGALLVQTKDGRSSPGTVVEAVYGSHARRSVEFEHGGARRQLDWFVAGDLFRDDGWRDASPSDVRQLFGKLGWRGGRTSASASAVYADNSLTGNGLQEARLLGRDYAGVYTTPDVSDNRSALLAGEWRRFVNDRLSFAGNAYYRHIRTGTVNGDVNEDAFGGTVDEPLAPYTGVLNMTHSLQHNYGGSGQMTLLGSTSIGANELTAGGAFDGSRVQFGQSAELGVLTAGRAIVGAGVPADDSAVDLDGRIRTWSVYATDTLSIGGNWHATVSGRYNRTAIHNRDLIDPGGGPGSLDGDHFFSRLNPAIGLTADLPHALNAYAGYTEGSRAATSIELGCADPEEPCRLPNAIAGDPPLRQVVARTWEAGLRAAPTRRVQWHAGIFRAENRDDILFVSSGQTGYGYFRNFGRTRRQGLQAGVADRLGIATVGAEYTLLDATYRTAETLNGTGNSTNSSAAETPGLDGTITIAPGDRIPLMPRHMLKANASIAVTSRLVVDTDVLGVSSAFARGNDNNRHEPDGTYYLGPGESAAYGVVNVGIHLRVTRWLQALAQIDNVLDRRYETAAQLGPTAFAADGTFAPRPLPPEDGAYPVPQSTFFAPGAPRLFWVGTRVAF
jgi:outer membrane receptor protein involved in Fe transport